MGGRAMTEDALKRRRGSGCCRRVLRGLWPDRNPLRRTTDRVETCLLAGLFVAAAAGAPFAAQAASHAEYASGATDEASAGTSIPGLKMTR